MPIPKTGNDSLDQYLNIKEGENSGDLTKQGFLVNFPSFPTASKDHRGRMVVSYGATGVADAIQFCRKKADDTYEWYDVTIANGSITFAKLATIPTARVYHNTTQSINTASETVLSFNAERFDTDTIHDNTTNNSRLTCKTAGKYEIFAHVAFDTNATGVRDVRIRLNGTTTYLALERNPALSGFNTNVNVSTIYDLAVNDYVDVIVYQNSGGALNILSAGNYTPEFGMVRIA